MVDRRIQVIREPYKNWAEGHIEKIRGILNVSRTAHTDAVKQRIDSVEQMKDIVSITEGLFAISKVGVYRLQYPMKETEALGTT